MKRKSMLCTFFVSLCLSLPVFASDACKEHLTANHGITRESVEISLKKEIEEFRTLAERALMLRAETIKVGKGIKEKMDRGKPLTGEDIALINAGINEHLSLRQVGKPYDFNFDVESRGGYTVPNWFI